jgi:hypothetical protein
MVGFMLLLLIGMIFLSILQTQVLPGLLSDEEIKHSNELTNDMLEFSGRILCTKVSAINFDLGVRYPKYPLLMSPPDMASTLLCDRFQFNLDFVEDYPISEHYNLSNVTGLNTSVRLNISVNHFVNPDYDLIFENTAVFKRLKTGYIVVSDQRMFFGDSVNVYIINTSIKSISTTSPIDVVVIPLSRGGEVIAKNFTMSFESVYPDYWNRTLRSLGYNVTVVNKTVTVNNVTVNKSLVTIRAENVKVKLYYVYLTKGVSVTPEASSEMFRTLKNVTVKPSVIVKTTFKDVDRIELNVNQSVVLGVRVLDQFRNPVIGNPIVFSSQPSAKLSPTKTYTDSEGFAYATFTPESEGDYTITVRCCNKSITFNVTAKKIAVSDNVSISLSCVEGWYSDLSQKTILAFVSSNGKPLPGYEVVFGINDTDAILNPTKAVTNLSGYAKTTIFQNDVGRNVYKIYAYAGDTYSDHDIVLNTFVPQGVHALRVYVENELNEKLEGYQVKIEIEDPNVLNQMRGDGRDLRVTESLTDPYNTSSGVPFWIESPPSSGKLVFWVRLDLNPRENKTIFVYWSGRDVESKSDGKSVFDYFSKSLKVRKSAKVEPKVTVDSIVS